MTRLRILGLLAFLTAPGRKQGRAEKLITLSKALSIAFVCVTAIVSPAQTFTTLLSFNGTNGAYPYVMSLVQGTDGNLYGTTYQGGTGANCTLYGGCGTVFKITTTGTLTTLYNFCSQPDCADGFQPAAGLVLATNGNFYGTTYQGGTGCAYENCGTVFEITPEGKLTTLHSFEPPDGANPVAGLVQAANGSFYGTTEYGSPDLCNDEAYCGTIYKITRKGNLKRLNFFLGTDGALPVAGLLQATNGKFYGTTEYGGANGEGTVFDVTAAGKLTTLYSFAGYQTGDGSEPNASLVQAIDGNFYGTTYNGGTDNFGTVFEITPGGTPIILHSFDYYSGDGAWPYAGLVQATDGNFYGTAAGGGTNGGYGTIFEITAGGTLTTLHSFDYTDGDDITGGLVQATNGTFYGTSYYGGANNYGTVFSLSVGLGPFVETNPTSGKVGSKVTILGNNLSGATAVSFNGTAATFKASSTFITTKVPTGATTGAVTVTTPSGTLTSNVQFIVP